MHKRIVHLGRGGEEPSVSSGGFFCPIVGFFGGVLILLDPISEVAGGIRGPAC